MIREKLVELYPIFLTLSGLATAAIWATFPNEQTSEAIVGFGLIVALQGIVSWIMWRWDDD